MFNYTASNSDVLSGVATNQAVAPSAAYSAYGRSAPTSVASTSTLLAANNIVVATASGITLTLPLTSTYAVTQLNTTQLVVYNSSSGSITVQGQSQFPSTSFSITGATTSGSVYSLDATHLPTVVGGSIATNLFTATADNASAQSFDNVVRSGITALTPQMVLTPGSIFTVDGTSTNTSLVLLNPTSGLLSNGSKIWCDDGGTMKNITAGNVVAQTTGQLGVNWTNYAISGSPTLIASTYGNGIYVAVGSGGTIYTSLDAQNWINRSIVSTASFNSITFANGLFLALGSGTFYISTNGITWINKFSTLPSPVESTTQLNGIAYGNGIYVLVGTRTAGSQQYILLSSPDLTTWSVGSASGYLANLMESVTFANNIFMIGGNGAVCTSVNGTTWQSFSIDGGSSRLATGAAWNGVVWALTTWEVASPNSVYRIYTSINNGNTWTLRQTLTGISVNVVWTGTQFATCGYWTSSNFILTSTDGITWSNQISGTTISLTNISYANNMLVIVGSNGNILLSAATSKYTCTAISPSLSNVPTWVAKGGQTLAGSISTTSTPNFSTVVPTTYTTTRVNNTLTITANQLYGFTNGTHVQLKAQTLNNGDIMSALNAVSNSQGINGTTSLTIAANASVSMIPTTNSGWIAV